MRGWMCAYAQGDEGTVSGGIKHDQGRDGRSFVERGFSAAEAA